MFIAIAVMLMIVTALVAFIRRDIKRNPGRDWHAEEGPVMSGRTPWRCCRADHPTRPYSCTVRIYPEDGATHPGDHVAEGRAEGEPDSVIARWAQ